MNSLILLVALFGAATAQYTPYSSAFGSGLSPFSGSGLGAYSPFRQFAGFGGGASSLSSAYGASPSMYGSASTSHPFYGSSPYGSGSSGPYSSGPYTTSFSSQPQYSASLGTPHTMSKDPNTQSSSSLYDRIPGMGGGGLISNLLRHRRPSLFSFRRGQPTAASSNDHLRPQGPLPAPAVGHFQYHPLPDHPYPPPPPPHPYPGHYSGHHPDDRTHSRHPHQGYDPDHLHPEHHSPGPDPEY